MPVINVTQEDLTRMKQPEAGWTLFEITDIKQEASRDKQSSNIVGEFRCEKGPGNTDKNIGRYMNKVQLLNIKNGNMVGSLFTELIPAVMKVPKNSIEPGTYDTDKLIGKKVWGEIKDTEWQGRIVKKLETFAPDDVVPF